MGGSSVMADAGRAMMLYRGLYDNTHTYEKLDVVNHNGSLYISTTDGNLGTEPTDGTKWKLFLQGGVSDNIQATDTYGLVGTKGDSSFVQLLLDSLASRVQGVALNRQTLGYTKKNLLNPSLLYNLLQKWDETEKTFSVLCDAGLKPFYKSEFKENTSYTISGYVKHDMYSYASFIVVYKDGSIENGGGAGIGEYKFIEFITNPNKTVDYIAVRYWGGTTTFKKFQIELGNMSTNYEPYVDDVDTRLQKIDDSILNTLEEIDANTSEENIAGALAIKSLKSNFANSIEAKANLISNSFVGVSVMEYDLADILNSTESRFAMLVSTRGYVATDDGGSLYFISGMTASQYVQVVKICGDDIYSPQISVAGDKLTIQAYDINGCNFSILKLIN